MVCLHHLPRPIKRDIDPSRIRLDFQGRKSPHLSTFWQNGGKASQPRHLNDKGALG